MIDWIAELGIGDQIEELFFLEMGVERGGVLVPDVTSDPEVAAIYQAGADALRTVADHHEIQIRIDKLEHVERPNRIAKAMVGRERAQAHDESRGGGQVEVQWQSGHGRWHNRQWNRIGFAEFGHHAIRSGQK